MPVSDVQLAAHEPDVHRALNHLTEEIGDRSVIVSIATGYLDDLPSSVAAMHEMDGSARSFAAHRLKSSSRAIGARALSGLCARLEADPDDEVALASLTEVAAESDRLIRHWIAGATDRGA